MTQLIAIGLTESQAKLIAAAPDMADALEEIMHVRAPHRTSIARAALAKAGRAVG
jgi:hypothetical protein